MDYRIPGVSGEQLAKRMLKIAWDASRVVGMGFVQDRGPNMSEDDVWADAGTRTPGVVRADYVYGRMMKLTIRFIGDTATIEDREWDSEYQSFCRKYPTNNALFAAAEATFATAAKA